jgi:mono/diheme cytochrome c family protein
MLRVWILLILLVPGAAAAQPMSRGEYLARVGDCVSCHTAPGKPAYAGGLAVHSPFGPIYSSNITPDRQYGIGAYSLDDFRRAVRRGVAKDGHHLYPAMPYVSFSAISDADMAALYDYFEHQVAPVHFKPPPTQLPFPFNQRWGMALWNLFFASRPTPRPSSDTPWERGAYLVQGAGHCGACHTPRSVFFNERGTTSDSPAFLAGGTLDNWHAPNLRGDTDTGLGRWSEGDIAAFLKTGHNGFLGAGVAAFGNMTQVVENSSQYMSDADRLAIAHYLKSLPPVRKAPPPPVPAPEREWPGAGLFAGTCARCHGADGRGTAGKGYWAPALAGNPAVVSADGTSVVRIILKGGRTAQTGGGPPVQTMPGFERLSDREIAEVATYVRQGLGASAPAVTPRQVARLRKALKGQPAQSVPSIGGGLQSPAPGRSSSRSTATRPSRPGAGRPAR